MIGPPGPLILCRGYAAGYQNRIAVSLFEWNLSQSKVLFEEPPCSDWLVEAKPETGLESNSRPHIRK